MKVFISWSGDQSKQLAEAIREWLPSVMQFVKPYFTPSDIDKGKRWNNEISKELGQSQIGIIAMTEENLTSPWIMFEAGAISKVVEEGLVCPILFGIKQSDVVGPLTSFQAIDFNRKEVRQLLTTINNAATKEVALTEKTLDAVFNKWWADLEEKVKAILTAQPPASAPVREERDLLEEAVENTRAILREVEKLPPWQRTFVVSEAYDAASQRRFGGLGGPLGTPPPIAGLGAQSPARFILNIPDEPPPGGGSVEKSNK
jgi:hypothetical protein